MLSESAAQSAKNSHFENNFAKKIILYIFVFVVSQLLEKVIVNFKIFRKKTLQSEILFQ